MTPDPLPKTRQNLDVRENAIKNIELAASMATCGEPLDDEDDEDDEDNSDVLPVFGEDDHSGSYQV